MPSGVEVAQAYITIIPSMRGIQGDIAKQLDAEKVGGDAGKKMGDAMSKGVGSTSEAIGKSVASIGERMAGKTKTSLGAAFASAAKTAADKMGGVASAVGQTIGTVTSTVGEKLAPIASAAKDVFGRVASSAKGAFDVVAKVATVGAVGAATALAGIVKSSLEAFSEYEQLAGGAQQIFSGIDYSRISADAQSAYKTMGLSANEYLASINQTGAAFKATMGDERGYETAKKGMQAISDYASGTGRDLNELNDKYSLITRSTSSYASIADQFSGILPATADGFLEQATAAGFLKEGYEKLTEVPIDEYQQAVTDMLARGVDSLNLTGNTAREAEHTISGSVGMMKASWANFVTELGKDDADIESRTTELVDSVIAVMNNVGPRVMTIVGAVFNRLPSAIAQQAPKVTQAVTGLLDKVTNGGFSKMAAAIQPYAERIGKAANDMAERFKPLAPVVADIGGKVGGILMTALEVATGAFETLAPAVATIAEHALPALNTILGAAGDAFSATVDAMEPVASFLSDTLSSAVEWIGDRIDDLAQLCEDAFGKIADAAGYVGDFLSDPLGKITDFAKNAAQRFNGTADTATNASDRTRRNVSGSFSSMASSVGSSTATAASTVGTNMGRLSDSVSRQGGAAASSAETNGARIKNAWDRTYTTKMKATADTSTAEWQMQSFKNKWTDFSVRGYATMDTSSASSSLSDWIYRNNNFVVTGSANVRTNTTITQGYSADGGIVTHKHAAGYIANRPTVISQHIVGEAGAEAIIPLTNQRYVAPFAHAVADAMGERGNAGAVDIHDCTFIVRKESDIDAIGRAINDDARRRERSKL